MTPTFDIKFLINKITNTSELVITDTSIHSGLLSLYGFFRVQYPDGIVVENDNVDAPDFDLTNREKRITLRSNKSGLIRGTYTITQKAYTESDDFESVKSFSFDWVEPSLLLKDNSSIALPSVSFLDITDYTVEDYNHAVSRSISAGFPEGTVEETISTTAIELFMTSDGNAYEGIYRPELSVDATYTGVSHSVQWIKEKEFVFDIRSFIGFESIVELINQVKDKLNESPNPIITQQYLMVTSLYSHIIAKLGIGEMDVADLVAEMQEIAYNLSCACCPKDYQYSLTPLPAYDPENFFGGFPFIDQVIYREWHEGITFSQTSTVFHRVDGRIKWYKSKSNDNIGNPIIIGGELNTAYWEPINDCCEYITFRKEFVYTGGAQEFDLEYSPKTVILVSTDGYGVYHSSDYSLEGNILTVLAPNELAVGTEVIVVATYNGDDIVDPPSGFHQIADFNGNVQFTSDGNRTIRFEGDGGVVIAFDTVLNKVIITGDSSIVSNTHAGIKSLSGAYIVGRQYIVTDHVTKHRVPGTADIHTHTVTEPVMLTAISATEFSIDAKSLLYPNHEIKYRFDLDVCEDGTTARPGMIVGRRDISKRTFVGCDYLGVVQRRYMILGKVYQAVAKTDDSNVTSTVASTRPTLTNRTRYEVSFATMTHPQGVINITLQYTNGSWVKPLVYHLDQEGLIPANYLSGKKGTIIYNPTLDAFVFMGFVDIGSELIGTYSSPISTSYTVGHGGITFTVDPLDYEDVPIFNGDYDNVQIPTRSGSLGTDTYYPNTVFRASVTNFKVSGYLYRNSFNGIIDDFNGGELISDSVFAGAYYETTVTKLMANVLMMGSVGTLGNVGHTYHRFYNCTVRPVNNMYVGHYVNDTSFIFESGSNFHLTGAFSESNVFMSGQDLSGGPLNGFYITGSGYRTLLGYVSSRYWIITKVLNNETIFKRDSLDPSNLLGKTKVSTLNIDTLQTATGTVTPLGRDSEGKVVPSTGGTGVSSFLGLTDVNETTFTNQGNSITRVDPASNGIKFYNPAVRIQGTTIPSAGGESSVALATNAEVITITGTGYTIRGIYEPIDNKEVTVRNQATGNVVLLDNSTLASAEWRIDNGGADFIIEPGNWAKLLYSDGKWRLSSAASSGTTTDVSTLDFYESYRLDGAARVPVLSTVKSTKDIVYTDDGAQIIYPAFMGTYIFTGGAKEIRGVGYTTGGGKEFKIVNSTGENLIIKHAYALAPADTAFNLAGGIDLIIPDGGEKTFKSPDGGDWVPGENNTVAFSDNLDSVNATINTGPDNLQVISDVYDKETGEEVTFKEVSGTPTPDGVIYIQIGTKYYKRIFNGAINILWYGANKEALTSDVFNFTNTTYRISEDYNLAGGTLTIPSNCTLDFRGGSLFNGNVVLNETLLLSDYKFDSLVSLTGSIRNKTLNAKNINFVNDTSELFYLFKLTGFSDLHLKEAKSYSVDSRILSTDANNFVTLSGKKNWKVFGNGGVITDARGNAALLTANLHFYFLKILTSSDIYIENLKYRTDDVNVEDVVSGKTWGCAFVQFAETTNVICNDLNGENISIGVGVSSSNKNAICKNFSINNLKTSNVGYHVILNGVEGINVSVEADTHAHRVIYSGGVKNANYKINLIGDMTIAQTIVLLQEYRMNDGAGYYYLHNEDIKMDIKCFGDVPGQAVAQGMYNYVENTSIGYDISGIDIKIEYFNQTSNTQGLYSGLVTDRSPSSPPVKLSGNLSVIYHNDNSNTSGRRDEPIYISSGDTVFNNIDFDMDINIISDTFQKKFPRLTYQSKNSNFRINSNTDLDASLWNFDDDTLGVPNIYINSKSFRPVGTMTNLVGPNLIVNKGAFIKTVGSVSTFKSIINNTFKYQSYESITAFKLSLDRVTLNRTTDLAIDYTDLSQFFAVSEERDLWVNNNHVSNTIYVIPSNFDRTVGNVAIFPGEYIRLRIGRRNGISFIETHNIPLATSTSNGLMSISDKTKLDNNPSEFKNGLYLDSLSNVYNATHNGLTGTSSYGILRNPGGGLFRGATQTGSIKIIFPDSFSIKMCTIKGTVFSYQSNESFSFFVSFYSEQTTEAATRASAKIIGSDIEHPIRIYTEAGQSSIYIGDLSTVWSLPNVSIDEVHFSYSSLNTAFFDGWAVSIESAFTGTLVGTITDTFPKSSINILSATPTLDFPSIAAGATAILTATVTGAVAGDNVNVTGPATLYASTCNLDGYWVSSANTVSIRVKNNGGSTVDLASDTYNIKVTK